MDHTPRFDLDIEAQRVITLQPLCSPLKGFKGDGQVSICTVSCSMVIQAVHGLALPFLTVQPDKFCAFNSPSTLYRSRISQIKTILITHNAISELTDRHARIRASSATG